jgi:hypothetical protein
LLHFCFELNSFSRHSSSSGERLYDIRRISSSKVFGLSKKQVSISAIHTTLPLYLQNMKENYFMTKRKPKVLKLQSNDSQDNSMQGVNLAFANSCELFIRDILPAVFFLLETSKLRIWFNFVIGSRKTHNLTCSYFLFHLVRSESARSTRSSYDFHILTALAAATKCCEWYFSSASTITYDKKAQLPKCGEVSSALKSIPKHPKGLSFQDFNRCCPLCLNKRVGPTLLIRSGYVEVQYLIYSFYCINHRYVFCFSCISEHVLKYNTCPVTKKSTLNCSDDLRMLYEVHC